MVHYLLLLRGEVAERHVGAHAHFPGYVLHQGPHQRAPGSHCTLVDGQRVVRHERGLIHCANDSRPGAGAAGAFAVEGQLLGPRGIYPFSADGAEYGLLGRHVEGRLEVVAVGAAVAGEAREHKPQAVEQFGHSAEGAADSGHSGPLVQRKGGRHIAYLVHHSPRGLGHTAAGICGQGFKVTPRAFGIENAQREGGLSRTRHTGNPDNLPEGDIYIYILEIMRLGASYFYVFRHISRIVGQRYFILLYL